MSMVRCSVPYCRNLSLRILWTCSWKSLLRRLSGSALPRCHGRIKHQHGRLLCRYMRLWFILFIPVFSCGWHCGSENSFQLVCAWTAAAVSSMLINSFIILHKILFFLLLGESIQLVDVRIIVAITLGAFSKIYMVLILLHFAVSWC